MKKPFILSLLLNALIIVGFISVGIEKREEIVQWFIRKRGHADIAMLGDSHTEYGRWSFELGRPVARLAKENYTSWQVQKVLLRLVIPLRPRLCFVLCGTNDLLIDPSRNPARVLVAYKTIGDSLRKHQIVPVFQTVPYTCSNLGLNAQIDVINRGLDSLAKSEQIELIDLNRITAKNGVLNYDYDGVHMWPAGYVVWGNALQSFLNKRNFK